LMAATEHVYFWVDDRLDFSPTDIEASAKRLEEDYYPRLVNLFGQEWRPGVDNDPHFSLLHYSGSVDGSELGYFSDTDEYPHQLYSDSNEEEMVYLVMGPLEQGEDLYYGTMVHEIQHLIQWYTDSNETTWLNEGLSQLAEIYMGLETADSYDYLRQPDIRLNTWEYENDSVDAHYAGAYLYTVRHLDFGRPDLEQRLNDPSLDDVKHLNQFGVHYIDLNYRGESTVTFAGDTTVNLIDSPPRSGEQMWFAPPQNDSSLQLTAAFDLSSLDSATLKFSTWYDLEEDYDFAYISISSDNGQSWDILTPEHSRVGEFGPSLNGRSADRSGSQDGWIKEAISLDSYVGQTVMIRFEVLTDSAVIGKGLALDDISIPELGYQTDVEGDPDGWQASGFIQTGWQIPQQWAVQLIEDGPNPTVTRLPLNDLNQAQWPLTIGKGGGVLVIIPLTPFAADPAHYWLQIQE
ncbi:MAG: immune inhibitor A, partial [Anaerolineae bacterium]